MTAALSGQEGSADLRRATLPTAMASVLGVQPSRSLVAMLVSLFCAVAAWHVLSTYFLNPQLFPPPAKIAQTAFTMVRTGQIFSDTAASLGRIAVGFALGSAAAIVLGVLMGRIRLVNELLDPIVEILRYSSPTAMIPIAVIWFGIGDASKYFLIFWGTFFFVLINTIAGVMRTPIVRERAAICLGASRMQVLVEVVIPSAVPEIVTGMRAAMAASFMAVIPAEMLASDSGLGFLLQQSSLLAQTDRVFVALAAICIAGFLTDRIFRILVKNTLSRFMAATSL